MAEQFYPVPEAVKERALIDEAGYDEVYKRSIEDNEGFWKEQAQQRIDWIKPFTKVKDVSFAKDDLHIRWYEDGTLNACYNCVDRHLEAKGDDVAIIWEGDDPTRDLKITYRELHERVCKFANAIKALGAKKGDRVTLEANTSVNPTAVYDLLDQVRTSLPLSMYNVTQVELTAVIEVDADKPPKRVPIRITYPNSCSLKYDEIGLRLRDMLEASGIEPKEPELSGEGTAQENA